MEQIRAAYIESGLLDEGGALALAVLRSIETGSNIAQDFIEYAYRLAEKAGYEDAEVVPDAIWDQAADTFDW